MHGLYHSADSVWPDSILVMPSRARIETHSCCWHVAVVGQYLNVLYADSIGEACFIDETGPENARAVKGEVAPIDDLSPDESGASFFHPTFALNYDDE